MKYIMLIGAVVVAGALILGGLVHLLNPYLFASSIAAYEIVPAGLITTVAVLLPCLMIITGLCILTGEFSVAACLVSCVIFLSFTAVQGWAILSGAEISCGCFGYSDEPISLSSMSLPASLLVVSAILFRSSLIRSLRCDQRKAQSIEYS